MIAGAHTRPSGQSQRIITPPSRKVRVPSTNESQNQNSRTPRIPQEKQKNERTEYVPIVLSSLPVQRRRHHRGSIGHRVVELQTVARDGRMSRLGSRYPNGGDEPITNSTHPTRRYPGHGKSSPAPSALVTAPLIRVDLTGVLHGAGSARTSGIAPIPDSHILG